MGLGWVNAGDKRANRTLMQAGAYAATAALVLGTVGLAPIMDPFANPRSSVTTIKEFIIVIGVPKTTTTTVNKNKQGQYQVTVPKAMGDALDLAGAMVEWEIRFATKLAFEPQTNRP